MPLEARANDDQDPLVVLSRDLDKANASLARAHLEHEAVRKRLGTRAPPPTKLPRAVPRPAVGSGAYRGKDERVDLQSALDEAKGAAAKLRAENSDLASQCDMQFPPTPFGATLPGMLVLTLVVVAAMGVVAWLLPRGSGEVVSGVLPIVTFLIFVYVRVFRKTS
jgi:hypothetical protein